MLLVCDAAKFLAISIFFSSFLTHFMHQQQRSSLIILCVSSPIINILHVYQKKELVLLVSVQCPLMKKSHTGNISNLNTQAGTHKSTVALVAVSLVLRLFAFKCFVIVPINVLKIMKQVIWCHMIVYLGTYIHGCS